MPRTAKGERIGHKHAGDDAECLISGAVQCRIRPMRWGGNLANLSMRSQPAKLKHMPRDVATTFSGPFSLVFSVGLCYIGC